MSECKSTEADMEWLLDEREAGLRVKGKRRVGVERVERLVGEVRVE